MKPRAFGSLLALLALAFIVASPYTCRSLAQTTAGATQAEGEGRGVSTAELVALFGDDLALCSLIPAEGSDGADAAPDLFCVACQLAKAAPPLLPEPPALPSLAPAGKTPAFPAPVAQPVISAWAPRDGPTRAPPQHF